MEKNREHLTVHYGQPVQGEIPVDAKDVFVQMISEGEKPSKSLRDIQAKYSVQSLDHSITFALLRAAFPNIDLMDEALSSRIIDSDYPNHTDSLTDQEFDEIVERIKDGSDSW